MRWGLVVLSIAVWIAAIARLFLLPNPCKTGEYDWYYGFPLTFASRDRFEAIVDDLNYTVADEYLWSPSRYFDFYASNLAINLSITAVSAVGLVAFCWRLHRGSVQPQISLADCFVVVTLSAMVLAVSTEEARILNELAWYASVLVFGLTFAIALRTAIQALGRAAN